VYEWEAIISTPQYAFMGPKRKLLLLLLLLLLFEVVSGYALC
jgi:hypothetical protein